jgi:hypothetical protein
MSKKTQKERRIIQALIRLKGGQCEICGATEKLHFHHLDKETKLFSIGSNLNKAMDKILEEVEKCILLCVECHKKEHGPTHGLTMYSHYKCRCEICRAAWNEKHKQYKKKYREKKKQEKERLECQN